MRGDRPEACAIIIGPADAGWAWELISEDGSIAAQGAADRQDAALRSAQTAAELLAARAGDLWLRGRRNGRRSARVQAAHQGHDEPPNEAVDDQGEHKPPVEEAARPSGTATGMGSI
jgi:hypothetical protein